MRRSRFHHLFRLVPLLVLLASRVLGPQSALAQSYNAICTMPDGSLLQVGDNNDVPMMAMHDAAWVVQPNPEGTPEKGEFTAVCTDAVGNLYLAYEDASNAKKKVEGLMRRVNGSWSLMPKLPKGWSGVSEPVAAGLDQLWFRSWLTEERRAVLGHWNGTAYEALSLPPEMSELHTLFLDSDGSLLADGEREKDAGVYRYSNGAWQPMGGAMDGLHVDRFVRLTDGTLVCNVQRGSYSSATDALYRWTGSAWEPLPGGEVAPKRDVEDLCAGPEGRLYLLIEADEEDGDPQRLACWKDGTLRWYKGSEDKAVQRNFSGTINLYQLACDRTGLLHARDYSSQRTYPWTDFEWAADGYPMTDARAAEVWTLYQQQHVAYGEMATALNASYRTLANTRTRADAMNVVSRYNDWYTWMSTRTDTLIDMVPKGVNRLVDRYREQLSSANLMYAAMRDHASAISRGAEASSTALVDKVMAESRTNKGTAQALEDELIAYPKRNGLAPMRSGATVGTLTDTYPAKDAKAASVLGVIRANRDAYNRHTSTCRTYLAGVDRMNGAAAFHLQQVVKDSLLTWVASVNAQLDALAVPPGQNRLQDAFRRLTEAISRMGYALDGYAGLLTDNSTAEQIRDQSAVLDRAQEELSAANTNLNAVHKDYLTRNGL